MPLTLCLDTNRYVDLCRADPVALDAVQRADAVILTFVVLAELRGGFRRGQRAEANERILTAFLQAPRVRVVLADEQTTHVYAEVYAALRRQGELIPTNDIWLAALCIQHDLTLFTRDSHFRRVPRLSLT